MLYCNVNVDLPKKNVSYVENVASCFRKANVKLNIFRILLHSIGKAIKFKNWIKLYTEKLIFNLCVSYVSCYSLLLKLCILMFMNWPHLLQLQVSHYMGQIKIIPQVQIFLYWALSICVFYKQPVMK